MSQSHSNPHVKRIILHAGLHKTGTTSIQHAFFEADESLKAHGVLYPTSWVSPKNSGSAQAHHNHFLHVLFKEDLTYYMRNLRLIPAQIEEDRRIGQAKLLQELHTTTADTIVISSENISLFEQHDLQRMYDFFTANFNATIDIYIYLREPVDWTRSMLQQLVWQNHTYQTAWNYLKRHSFMTYTSIYARCAQVFGTAHTHIRTYEGLSRHPEGIVAGFCHDTGITVTGIDLPQFHVHTSATQFTVHLCDYINTHEPAHKNNMPNPLRAIGDKKSLRLIRGPRFEIPAPLAHEVHGIFAPYVHTLREQFGIDYTIAPTNTPHTMTAYTLDHDFYTSLTQAYTQANHVIRTLMTQYLQHASQHETRLQDIDRQRFVHLIAEFAIIPEHQP